MKKIFLISALALLALMTSCEKQKQVPKQSEIDLSFEYREVVSDKATPYKFEYRSTSKPKGKIDPNDLWYMFHDRAQNHEDWADAIGDGYYYLESSCTFSFRVFYKPAIAPEPDDVYASRKFAITITGVADSTWRAATPLTETVPYQLDK